jgi:hypothetical protein
MHPSPPTIPPYLRRVKKEPVWSVANETIQRQARELFE